MPRPARHWKCPALEDERHDRAARYGGDVWARSVWRPIYCRVAGKWTKLGEVCCGCHAVRPTRAAVGAGLIAPAG